MHVETPQRITATAPPTVPTPSAPPVMAKRSETPRTKADEIRAFFGR